MTKRDAGWHGACMVAAQQIPDVRVSQLRLRPLRMEDEDAVRAAVGIDRVLLTCDDDNVASATVIERCGGVLDPAWPRTDEEAPKRRYWIA